MALTWRPTSLPAARSRTDDVFFLDENLGWAVNSDGKVFRTTDGAANWEEQQLFRDSYLRCLAFASPSDGWIGAIYGPHPLYRTRDGGRTWAPVEGLPPGGPGRICGLVAVSETVVFAAGTNFPDEPAGVFRTTDGGETWDAVDLGGAPAALIDILFTDPATGWVVGGLDEVRHPDRTTERRDLVPAVFATTDGGETWTNVVAPLADLGAFPRGEWGWKIQKLGESTLFVSLENFHDGAILRSDDLGRTWRRLRINDRQRNANLEGVGFLDERRGWVGGWGDYFFGGGYTSATEDGGENWVDANHVGFRVNRFRFLGDPVRVGYASGDTVYKLSDEPIPPAALATPAPEPDLAGEEGIGFSVEVPAGARRLEVLVWDRFGRLVRRLNPPGDPTPGPCRIDWDFTTEDGAGAPPGEYILRVLIDEAATSRVARRLPLHRLADTGENP